eukprot:CAMPEP_0183347204 /NCGR_PEP_ID=MMETSP0164_2-20130417/12102_1 /TAXON_ID=221442 /ORGANISM="Coccolithus pelagicus ssp braarudi, Strain PLY182g" /LENGTH=37 /DNA_ID= /DNA_START= /DNA_END= /DNA_ORIENTATION=
MLQAMLHAMLQAEAGLDESSNLLDRARSLQARAELRG